MSPLDELQSQGRVWLRGLLPSRTLDDLACLLDVADRPGVRLSNSSELESLLGHSGLLAGALKQLGLDPSPVRLVAFNKSEKANWAVPWHQDRVIAVKDRRDVPGYSNWVRKSDFWHCEPPHSLIASMVFARIHIDANTEENGPMQIALGSHLHGQVSASEASILAKTCKTETCLANAGDVLIVHALTLHRSGSAEKPVSRRALRVDYAKRSLLYSDLSWAF